MEQNKDTLTLGHNLDYVPLTNDLLFHMVFTKNKGALRSLLSCILNIPEKEIVDIVVLNPMQYSESFDMNLTVLDLKLHLNGEKFILIEMQVRRFLNWTNRTLVYACRQISEQDKGDDFDYSKLQPVIQIAIMDHTLFSDHKKFVASYELRDEEGFLYSDKLRFIVMDLTSVDKATAQESKQGLVEWAEAFKANDWLSIGKINNPGVKEAAKTMEMIMATPSERELVILRRKTEIDRRSEISNAVAEERNNTNALIAKLFDLGRIDDVKRIATEPGYRDELYQELFPKK